MVLPDRGVYSLTVARPDGRVRNVPYRDIEEMARDMVNADAMGHTIYFGLSGFREEQVPSTKFPGQTYFPRTQNNAEYFSSLWLDVDIGPDKAGKGFLDQDSFIQGLGQFLKQSKLPMPMVVSSGFGVHLYWPLNQSIPKSIWQPMADALKTICIGLGFPADPTRTADAASVLRPVGTHHRKSNTPLPVYIARKCAKFSAKSIVTCLLAASAPFGAIADVVVAKNAPVTQDLLANVPAYIAAEPHIIPLPGSLPRAEAIVQGCPQIAQMGSAPEPAWRGAMTVLTLCGDGAQTIHDLSSQDPRYEWTATEHKIHQVRATCGPTGMPATCQLFDSTRAGVCTGCSNYGRIKSPIVLGLPKQTEAVELPIEHPPVVPVNALPPGIEAQADQVGFDIPFEPNPEGSGSVFELDDYQFKLTRQGVMLISKDEEGDDVEATKNEMMCEQRVYPIARSWFIDSNRNKRFIYHWRVERTVGGYADYHIPGSDLHNRAKIVEQLGDWGVVIRKSKHHEHIATYMRAYVNATQNALPEVQLHDHFGWDGVNNFVVGDRVFTPEGQVLRAQPYDKTARLSAELTVAGDHAKWSEAFEVLTRPGQEHALFAVSVGFAAPLMKFTESRGFLVHMNGPKGRGKSTIQKVCNSIWGSPKSLMIQQPGSKAGDTFNALMAKLGTAKHLPVCLEEITNYAENGHSEFVHMLAGGEERGRLSASSSIRDSGSWHTAFLSSANMSLRSKLAEAKLDSEAEQSRFFEIDLPVEDVATWRDDGPKLAQIDHNYGTAGHIYSRWLARNASKLGDAVQRAKQDIEKRIDANQADRFLTSFLAAQRVGLQLAIRSGAIPGDMDMVARLDKWIDKQVDIQRRHYDNDATASRISSLLGDMLGDLVPHTLVVSSTADPLNGGRKTYFAIHKPRGELWARVEQDADKAFVSRQAVQNWCRRRGVEYNALINRAQVDGYLLQYGTSRKNPRVALGKGITEFDYIPASTCIGIHTNRIPGYVPPEVPNPPSLAPPPPPILGGNLT